MAGPAAVVGPIYPGERYGAECGLIPDVGGCSVFRWAAAERAVLSCGSLGKGNADHGSRS